MATIMTSRQAARWFAYFQAMHEIATEAVGLSIPAPASASAPRRPGERLLSEAEIDAFFLAHAKRAA